MKDAGTSRRRATIVSADVAGYSRLMGVDEEGTLAAFKSHRQELIDPKIAECGGRVVNVAGDGMLMEFSSAVDAVECCIAVQRGIVTRNQTTPIEQRLQFRIGINVADVLVDGDDIFGDGVNIAARLEGVPDHGSVSDRHTGDGPIHPPQQGTQKNSQFRTEVFTQPRPKADIRR